jgi:hypothetical protein
LLWVSIRARADEARKQADAARDEEEKAREERLAIERTLSSE